MRLAEAFHSLPCPSSVLKPSHSLYGLNVQHLFVAKEMLDNMTFSIGGLNTSPCGLVRTSPTYQTTLLGGVYADYFWGLFQA